MAKTRSVGIGQGSTDHAGKRYVGRSRSYGNLGADMQDFADLTEKRILALQRQSLSDVIENAQQAIAKGGRMRVDIGFLRASGQASLTGMPTGPGRPPKDAKPGSFNYNHDVVIAVLAKMKIGSVFYFGWTANYAVYRELYDGFLEGALQHWGRIVAFNADTIRERIKK